jgi:hypothetical protein
MTAQLPLPGFAPVPERPPRRTLWRAEMARAMRIHADERARDRQRHADMVATLAAQIEDIRRRIADIERASGIADIRRAPVRRGELRAFGEAGRDRRARGPARDQARRRP